MSLSGFVCSHYARMESSIYINTLLFCNHYCECLPRLSLNIVPICYHLVMIESNVDNDTTTDIVWSEVCISNAVIFRQVSIDWINKTILMLPYLGVFTRVHCSSYIHLWSHVTECGLRHSYCLLVTFGPYILQIYTQITEVNYLHLSTDCFMKCSLQSSGLVPGEKSS